MASFLITGASRGLGLELTRQLVAFPPTQVGTVFATSRGESAALKQLSQSSDRIVIVKLDVTDKASINQAAGDVEAKLAGKGLDVLVNNAGILQYTATGVATMENLTQSFETNVLGVHRTTQAFLPLLKKGHQKKLVNISTTVGALALASYVHAIPAPAYKISKAALNALTIQYSLDLGKEGFTVIALSPGWLKTDLGTEAADLPVEQGARASLEKIMAANKEQNGQFLNIKIDGWQARGGETYDGSNAPW